MSAYWSWLLTAWGVTGLVLAGRKRAAGWAVGLSAQALWIAYAIATRQWGFIASAIAYGVVYARNWLAWRRPSVVIPPLLCWRCGADCTTTHTTIHDLGHDMHVCAEGCVPTVTKETP